MTVNELLQQQGISHAVYLERLKTGEVRRIISLLNEIDRDLVETIAARAIDDESFTKRRLEALLRDMRSINKEAQAALETSLQQSVEDLASYESRFQAKRLQTTIPIEWNITQPAPEQLLSAVLTRPFENALFAQHIERYGFQRMRLVEGAIRMGYAEGQTIPQIARRIRGTRAAGYSDGILEESRRSVESLVRTSLNHTTTTARENLYGKNDDLVKGVQIVATLDGRTTLICMNQDGNVYQVGEGPRPPFHWGCRTTTAPVTKSWRELGINRNEIPPGTRASMNGQIPETTTYTKWLKNQPSTFQREVLGAKRYEMYKAGTPIDRFVRDNRVLTLKELEQRENPAA